VRPIPAHPEIQTAHLDTSTDCRVPHKGDNLSDREPTRVGDRVKQMINAIRSGHRDIIGRVLRRRIMPDPCLAIARARGVE
jgi:hypothetical protein